MLKIKSAIENQSGREIQSTSETTCQTKSVTTTKSEITSIKSQKRSVSQTDSHEDALWLTGC